MRSGFNQYESKEDEKEENRDEGNEQKLRGKEPER